MQPCKGSSLLKADTGPQQVQQTVRQQLMKSSTTLFFIITLKDLRSVCPFSLIQSANIDNSIAMLLQGPIFQADPVL